MTDYAEQDAIDAERFYAKRMSGAPLAFELMDLVTAALSYARSQKLSANLFYLQEQLDACLNRHQDVDKDSARLVMGVVWEVETEWERFHAC